jgi:hypothetical protein
MSLNTRQQNAIEDIEEMKQEKGLSGICAEALKDMNHWCSRVGSTNEDKLDEYQPYYAGDLTQK